MRHLLLIVALVSGCKSNPYCLNCQPGSGGGGDGGHDLAGADLAKQIDMAGQNGDGGCVVTNNGVEICDGVDNDCNGLIDDNVDPSKLVSDPNNCGKCGHACDYSALHQFGACTSGMCAPSGCTPGFVDVDGNPANGCEYQCTKTNGGVEICDGLDNDCNGTIDDPFTTTFAGTKPNYDKDVNNCGGCGFKCTLPNATNACVPGTNGAGVCHVVSCDNTPGTATYRHNPANGDINVTGCEYKCPDPASSPGDCNAIACTFPPEVCDGKDNDCNFLVDENDPNLSDSDLVPTPAPCGQTCPGLPPSKCKCQAGHLSCKNGVKQCVNAIGPSPIETCNGIDDNCDGLVDEIFTQPSPAGYLGGDPSQPLYNQDSSNCGGCNGLAGYNGKCNLPNAVNSCISSGANQFGNCHVVSCNPGFNFVTHTDSNKSNPKCDVSTVGTKDSLPKQVSSGLGCFYQCSTGFEPPLTSCSGCFPAPTESVCDGKDNNCDGCIDNNLAAPTLACSNTGACAGKSIPVNCLGPSGWKCNYGGATGGGPQIDFDPATGLLRTTETTCDGLDNNCNGFCDENFPQTATAGLPFCKNNPNRTATSCTAGFGVCQGTGIFVCSPPSPTPAPNPAVCNAVVNSAAATDETCDGVDNNCNGVVDDPNPGVNNKKGYVDPVIRVTVPQGDNSPLVTPTPEPQHVVYVYPFEASRPDSTSGSPGGLAFRSCAKSGVLPWSGATQDQARQACVAAGGRLCTAFEWTSTCEGPAPTPSPNPVWSQSQTPNTYASGVCNDQNRISPNAVWTTAHGPNSGTNICSVSWPNPQGGAVADLSGNLFEWTSTPILFQSLIGGSGASIDSAGLSPNQMRISGMSGLIGAGAVPGQVLQLTGSPTNNGFYAIVQVVSDSTAVVTRLAYSGATASGLGWSLINTYYKLRGGSFTSPPGGTDCRFDFDIAPLSFANTDLGFRCCFDKKPCVQDADCTGIGNGKCTGIGTKAGGFCP
jgi:formylglycine-generating enzyme required for sulfatase activity